MRTQTLRTMAAVLLATIVGAGSAIAQDTDPLVEAYQKEFIFLDNEIRLLQQRLEEVQADGEARIADARNALGAVENELLDLVGVVDQTEARLNATEESAASSQSAGDTLRNIITQAYSRLETYEVPDLREADPQALIGLNENQQQLRELRYALTESLSMLGSLSSVRTEQDSFFLDDGTQVQGDVTYIGGIAAFGVTPRFGGTLAPAGEGRLRLVDSETFEVAEQLVTRAAAPTTLPLFIYDSLDNAVDTDSGQSFSDTVEGGGLIGQVILGIGAVAVLLILLRVGILMTTARGRRGTVGELLDHVRAKDLSRAQEVADSIGGALGRVIRATVRGLRADPGKIEDVISESVLNEQPRLERFRSALSVFAAVAPLLGLLGTVTGMIATFDIITQFGTGDPKLLSGGISEALITTELGLAVAIPTLLIGNLLASWSDRITSDLEVSALRVVNVASGFEGGQE